MLCMARLVRAILGSDAVAEGKMEWGRTLRVLGVDLIPSWSCLRCNPASDKVEKCINVIKDALAEGNMHAGCATKLAGRLSWAAQFLFRRLGRAMLRPIFWHGRSRCV